MKFSTKSPFSVKPLAISTCLLSTLLLVGCQSMPSVQPSSPTALSTAQTPAAAKTMIINAQQQQRRQSLAYHSNIEINNDKKFMGINTDKLMATGDDVDSYCEDKHDQDYIALTTEAAAQDKDLSDAIYDEKRNALKNTYLACTSNYRAWRENQNDYADDYLERYSEAYDNTSSDENTETASVSPYYEKLFSEYDTQPTKLSVKKQQLLDAYLLKPLSIDVQGVYQPLAGRFTMLPSAQYSARNHHSSISQPIYVDAKSGNIYLWADNFAMFNASYLDDKLGTTWKNKWLKIAMNDGSLPKGFGMALVKSHFKAMDDVYAQADTRQFEFVTAQSLNNMSPKLPAHQLQAMQKSSQIIRRLQDEISYEQAQRQYYSTLYSLIGQQYPELIKEADNTVADDDKKALTSKVIVQQGLAMMKNMFEEPDDADATDSSNAQVKVFVQDLSGLDSQGKLLWQHQRLPLSSIASSKQASTEQVVIDVLNQYAPIREQDSVFPNLPSNMQIPSAQNSVDLKDYSQVLTEYYRDGHGTAVGKMIFNVLPMAKARFGATD